MTSHNVNVLPLANSPVAQGVLGLADAGEDRNDSEEDEEAKVIFYSEGLSNHTTSHVPSAVDTMTNRKVPSQYD